MCLRSVSASPKSRPPRYSRSLLTHATRPGEVMVAGTRRRLSGQSYGFLYGIGEHHGTATAIPAACRAVAVSVVVALMAAVRR